MEFGELVALVAAVRATPKKTEKVTRLATGLRQVQGRELVILASYLAGTIPQGRIGVGWKLIEAAMPQEDRPPDMPLGLTDVDRTMNLLASDQGSGSFERRRTELRRLFERAVPEERRFLGELLIGEIRQGALEGLLLDAIAKAADVSAPAVRGAMMFSGDIGEVARLALEEGTAGLARIEFQLLNPIAPMLANAAADPAEALERLGEASFEYKLDGARIQVHKQHETIRIFTRQLQDVTNRLPELIQWTAALPVREFVLEGEAIALRQDGRPLPFQVTMRRFGRVNDIEAARRDIPLSCFFFDCLYVEGRGSLLAKSYRERMEALDATVPPTSLIPRLVTGDRGAAEEFLRQALDAGHEGVMAKSQTAPYVAGQRGFHWLKIKEAKTLDLVVLAAEWGNGRRTGFLSNLHLGARDPETGRFIMLGKTFKGMTDALLRWQTEQFLALEERRDGMTVYVKPARVVEIAFSDIQESPRYPGGLALRFARVKRYRPDKTPQEADTLHTVKDLFHKSRQ
ncbi:putative DNA ligase [Nitrospira japonica]|uniref:Probable DNA ligase n=1 Tax=Nitrospira japonica TaxID=1325564 RepID=A0A1W1I8Z2_9BACT|nr:putative DNA ligase [Nitrospira japonica]